jgi:hypothetical protein
MPEDAETVVSIEAIAVESPSDRVLLWSGGDALTPNPIGGGRAIRRTAETAGLG